MPDRSKKRRIRSPHPGIILIEPTGRYTSWRARFKNPDTHKLEWERLDPIEYSTAEARREWAKDKSRELTKRTIALEGGAVRATGTSLEDAIEGFYEAHPRLRPKTKKTYQDATDKLVRWAEQVKAVSADDLTMERLRAFRKTLVTERKKVSVANSKGKGKNKVTGELRSAFSVNRELRSIGTVLTALRKDGLLPRLNGDGLKDGLEKLETDDERPTYLKSAQLVTLLESALAHDKELFTITREEHKGLKKVGTTPRYPPIAPFVLYVLLTGCRLGECVGALWEMVDLEALDDDGKVAGEIYLPKWLTKTKKDRTLVLEEVSPVLRTLLTKLHEKKGSGTSVFGYSEGDVQAAGKRLRADYGAPTSFTWQELRRTCSSFLTNAPGIFGAASAYRSAKQLGHAVAVAEVSYAGLIKGIPRTARTLEAAMKIEDVAAKVIASV